jgi:hypothetical protein
MDKHLSHHSQLRTISSRILMKFEREERERKKSEGRKSRCNEDVCVRERKIRKKKDSKAESLSL